MRYSIETPLVCENRQYLMIVSLCLQRYFRWLNKHSFSSYLCLASSQVAITLSM